MGEVRGLLVALERALARGAEGGQRPTVIWGSQGSTGRAPSAHGKSRGGREGGKAGGRERKSGAAACRGCSALEGGERPTGGIGEVWGCPRRPEAHTGSAGYYTEMPCNEMDLPLEEQGESGGGPERKGASLVRVKDSDVWHKQVDAEAKKAKKAAEKARKKVTASKTQSELPPSPRLTFDTDNRRIPPALRPNPTHQLPHPAVLHLHALSRPANGLRAPDAPPHQYQNEGPHYDSCYNPHYNPRDRQYDGCYESRHQSRPRSPLHGPATHTATDGSHTEGKREDRLAARRRVGRAPQEDPPSGACGRCTAGPGGSRDGEHIRGKEEGKCVMGWWRRRSAIRVFYATRLEKTIVGKADCYMFIHDAEKKNVATLIVDDAKGIFDYCQLRISLPARGNGDMGHGTSG
ncbi:hypothetical protein B0H14DRAFT_2641254 [Mycena olivaceomarginata]|nr:hypothetical protein B0H14DRAFT_2641254 [Mycena olivaceomarginata]